MGLNREKNYLDSALVVGREEVLVSSCVQGFPSPSPVVVSGSLSGPITSLY
ncbi:hypothetical protein KA405_05270 [Patescibacteria group bacterium]|nr:hypothetical protein [Patescibacteria group bacterium]